MKIVRIPSKLYAELFFLGGDKLISVYSILKSSRDGEIKYYAYTSKNNKFISGYSLLRNKTILSLHSIKKYVPLLINLGLCFIDKNGDFVLLGNDKLKQKYNGKLVPITLGKNIADTADNVYLVRAFSTEKNQKTQIEKKQTRSEIIACGSHRLSKFYESKYGNNLEVNEKIVLSLQGFGVLKHGEANSIKDIKSSGSYYKRKLSEKGLITTNREFKKIQKVTYSEYLNIKKYYNISNKMKFNRGWLVEEQVSSFSVNSIVAQPITQDIEVLIKENISIKEVKVEQYKKKPYLEFDMIDFWINGGNN